MACGNDIAPAEAGLIIHETPQAPALDHAPRSTTLKGDPRFGPVMATARTLIELHYPEATDVRINLDRVFGGAYQVETFTHKDRTFQRVDGDADFTVGYTIMVSDLKLVSEIKATMMISMLHATEKLTVTDEFFEVELEQKNDVWSVSSLISKRHFDGVLKAGS